MQVSGRSSGKARSFFARIQRTGQSDHSKANKATSTSFVALLSHSGPGGGGRVSLVTRVVMQSMVQMGHFGE